MIFTGLDEAALGPTLGPFCACLTRFGVPGDAGGTGHAADLAELLAPAVDFGAGNTASPAIRVGDSKTLYSGGRGLDVLETAVLAFLQAAGAPPPASFAGLLDLVAPPEDREAMKAVEWYSAGEDLKLPVSEGFDTAACTRSTDALERRLEDAGAVFGMPALRIIPAGEFNRRIVSEKGKSGAIRSILNPLVEAGLASAGDEVWFTVDRQGGRRYYGEWLLDLFPGAPLRCLEEGPERSAYAIKERSVEFLVKADASRMEVALASMFAKYVRELAMILFNEWWCHRVPNLRTTAGYPQDARRFLADLEAAGAMPTDSDILVRMR